MGKTVGKVLGFAALAIGVVALTMTGAGLLLLPAGFSFALAGMSAATLMTISSVLAIGASLLSPRPKAPGLNSATLDRLQVTLNPRASRKALFGSTALATDLQDQHTEKVSDELQYVHRWMVLAAHRITSLDELWFDNEKVWTLAGGVIAKYSGWLTVTVITEGSSTNTIAAGPNPTARRFTGCAYVYFRYKIAKDSPFASNIPTRVTPRGKGMPVYDPRQDSTVSGGAGTQRANDQTTWAFDVGGTLAGENPACQLLTWMLGWKINSKLSVGKGIPADRINLASFITAANACDETVTLATGGTQKRYRAGGITGEDEDPIGAVDRWKASMNATLDDVDGQIRLTVLVNDLAAPVFAFTDTDIIDDFSWKPTETLVGMSNIIRGSYVDASDQALYQLAEYPEVKLASLDGIDRIETADYAFVQDSRQAQRLSKQRLQRALYAGMFQAVFQITGTLVQKGDPVSLTFPALGFSAKIFRVVEMEYRPDGTCPMTLREENTAIYAWMNEDAAVIVRPDPTVYDAMSTPLRVHLDSIEAGADVTAGNIAAGIVGQAATATSTDFAVITGATRPSDYATVGADVNSVNLIDSGNPGGTITLPRNEVRTPLGTAAAIAGQGALATQGSVAYGGPYVSGFGSLAGRSTARFSYELYEGDGVTLATEPNYRTSSGTAAAISGQGALATRGDADISQGHIHNGGWGAQYAAALVTAQGTAAAIAGQGALATVNQITMQYSPGRFTDNITKDPPMEFGAQEYATAGGVTLVAAGDVGAPPSMPAYKAYGKLAGATGGQVYANGSNATPYQFPRAHVSAMIFSSGGSLDCGTISISCYDAAGNYLGQFAAPLVATAYNTWQRAGGWVNLHSATAQVAYQWTGVPDHATANRYMTGMRFASAQPGATLGADINSVDLFDTGGATPTVGLPRSEVRTPLGIASAIAGQTAWATYGGETSRLTYLNVQGRALSGFVSSGDGRPFGKIVRSGEAANGEAVSFGTSYGTVPKMTFLPGGKAPVAGASVAIRANNLTVSGFTMKATEQTVTAGSTITDTTGTTGSGADPDRMIDRSNASAPWNGAFTFTFTVTVPEISGGEPGMLAIDLFVKQGGVWINVGSYSYSSSGTKVETVYPGTVDTGVGYEFGVDKDTVGSINGTLDSFTSVSYSLGSTTENSLTTLTKIPYLVMLEQ